jgi:hypothetical protein
MATINPNKLLASHLVIESSDKLLHRIGLYKQINDKTLEKSFIRRKIILTTFISITFVQALVFSIIPEQNKTIQMLFGDFGHLSGLNIYLSLALLAIFYNCLATIILYHKMEKKGSKLTSFRVFRMISGSLTPESIGLTNEKYIISLISKIRVVLNLINIQSKTIVPIFSFTLVLIIYMQSCSTLKEVIIYGAPILSFTLCQDIMRSNYISINYFVLL